MFSKLIACAEGMDVYFNLKLISSCINNRKRNGNKQTKRWKVKNTIYGLIRESSKLKIKKNSRKKKLRRKREGKIE